MNLLILHHSATTRRHILNALRELEGVALLEQATGSQAMHVLAHETMHVIVLGMDLGDMRGLDVVRHLRQSERYAQTPVLYLSPKGAHEDVLEALEAGVDTYVLLPFQARPFREKVQQALARARKQLEARRRPPQPPVLKKKKYSRRQLF